jgi:hypothetical protein
MYIRGRAPLPLIVRGVPFWIVPGPLTLSAIQKASGAFRVQDSPQMRSPCCVGRCFSLASVWEVSLSRSNRSSRFPVFLCCARLSRKKSWLALQALVSVPVAARVDSGTEAENRRYPERSIA